MTHDADRTAVEKGTVLVTGGSGYLGGWCVAELLRRGHEVRTTVRSLAREGDVRAAIAQEADPGERLSVVAADLTDDAGWADAVRGCDYVLHVASPLPPSQPKDPDEVIVPAREGTLRVLRHALEAGAKRVVITSSVAAVRNSGTERPDRALTEDDWSDPDNTQVTPYSRSKTIAERAAWKLVDDSGARDRLAAVNPSAILGPVLSDDTSYSLEVVQRMLRGMPGVPNLGFSFVDVRDVADLHICAMTAPDAGGERFLATHTFLWLSQVAAILRERLGERAAKVPTRTVPNIVVRGMALFDGGIRAFAGDLGKQVSYSSDKARTRLGWSPRPVEDTIAECAESLLRHDAVAA